MCAQLSGGGAAGEIINEMARNFTKPHVQPQMGIGATMSKIGVAQEGTSRPRHILTLSALEKRNFINSFDRVFSDIDGVVWHLDSPLDGGPEGFKALKEAGKKVVFVTNNSMRPEESSLKRFKSVDLEVAPEEIVHPVKSVIAYLKQQKFKGLLYVIGSKNFKHEIKRAGYQIIDGPERYIEESFSVLARHVFNNEPVRGVIIDADINLSLIKMMRAEQYARDPKCLLIGGITDEMLPLRHDITIMGPGLFVKMVEKTAKREAIILGKPGRGLAELLLQQYAITEPQRVLMIGDMLQQDIALGRVCGFQTLAVLSGGCTLAALMAETRPEYTPDFYADSMADFVQLFKDLTKAKC